jgi:RNA polymerase-binding transcription factor DksA
MAVKVKWLKRDLNRFKKLILAKREDLLEAIDRAKKNTDNILEGGSVNAIYSSHMADAGSDHQEREKAFYWLKREMDYLHYLERALDMIDDGSFGICKDCGEKIPETRLIEVPHTTTCYTCKTKIV